MLWFAEILFDCFVTFRKWSIVYYLQTKPKKIPLCFPTLGGGEVFTISYPFCPLSLKFVFLVQLVADILPTILEPKLYELEREAFPHNRKNLRLDFFLWLNPKTMIH